MKPAVAVKAKGDRGFEESGEPEQTEEPDESQQTEGVAKPEESEEAEGQEKAEEPEKPKEPNEPGEPEEPEESEKPAEPEEPEETEAPEEPDEPEEPEELKTQGSQRMIQTSNRRCFLNEKHPKTINRMLKTKNQIKQKESASHPLPALLPGGLS